MMSHGAVPGLVYHPAAVRPDHLARFERYLRESNQWERSPGTRRVIQYGRAYDYRSTKATAEAPPMSPPIAALASWAANATGISRFDQAIVNEYEPGQGIAPHVDSSAFGPAIACITLGGEANMVFRRGERAVTIRPARGSCYIMTGDARTAWTHEMPKRKSDRVAGVRVPRITRYSVTFRTMAR